MIRFPVSTADLDAAITKASKSWFVTAAERVAKFEAVDDYDEKSGAWSRIKRVFMEVQGHKCGFCERRLERSAYGAVEHDVEHFRPKKEVKKWPSKTAAGQRNLEFDFELGDGLKPAYFRLAYERENYLISCKTCNSALKANNFPVAGTRTPDIASPRALNAELPYLIYPIGDVDDADPEDLLGFNGIVPIVRGATQHDRRRAEVTINLFELDTREILLEERAEIIVNLHLANSAIANPHPEVRAAADLVLTRAKDVRSPHTNCARSYLRVLESDPPLARAYAASALDHLIQRASA